MIRSAVARKLVVTVALSHSHQDHLLGHQLPYETLRYRKNQPTYSAPLEGTWRELLQGGKNARVTVTFQASTSRTRIDTSATIRVPWISQNPTSPLTHPRDRGESCCRGCCRKSRGGHCDVKIFREEDPERRI